MSHPAAPCHLDREPATAVTEARTPTGAQRHVMDLLDLDPGHHALVRLSLAEWRRVSRVVEAIEDQRHELLIEARRAAWLEVGRCIRCDHPLDIHWPWGCALLVAEPEDGGDVHCPCDRIESRPAQARVTAIEGDCSGCGMPGGRHWDTCPNRGDGRPTR